MNLFAYLKKPHIVEANDDGVFKKLIAIFKLYLIYMVCIMVVGFLLRMMDRHVLRGIFEHSILRQLMQNMSELRLGFVGYWFFVLVIFGPFMEELLFRLPLRLGKFAFATTLSLVCYRLLVDHFYTFDIYDLYAYLNIVIALGVFLFTIKVVPKSALVFLRKHYGYYFYFIAVAFALVHLQNFGYFKINVLLFYPLFVLPQFVMGLFIGYVRMEYGFLYGVLFHSMINLPSYLF